MSRVLMKDGCWLVPAEKRPRGWESMGLAEMNVLPPEPKPRKQRTVTATKSEHTVERHITESLSVTEEMSDPEPQPTVAVQAQAALEPAKPLMSHVPDNPPDYRDLAEAAISLYGGDEEMDDFQHEACFDLLELAGERVATYRKAKVLTDTMLTEWVTRHGQRLRHIGLGSKPIQDLWSIVQQLMWDKLMIEKQARWIAKLHDDDRRTDGLRKLLGMPKIEDERE